jgi:uracil-DNA glycosylase
MSERPKPSYCYESGCPLANSGARFCLGSGDPTTEKMAIMLEAPGSNEIDFVLRPENFVREEFATQAECDRELAIRKRDYPGLAMHYLMRGVALVGKSASEMRQWVFPVIGVKRSEVFIDNTLRCLPPKMGDSNYPKGWERKRAEACCRHYDRWHLMKPDVAIVSLHPAAIVREPVPLPLQIKNFEKARDFVKAGLKVVVLAGGKAAKWWLGFGGIVDTNVTKWQGHYQVETPEVLRLREARLVEYALASPKGKKNAGQKDAGGKGKTRKPRGASVNAVEAFFGASND